MLVVVTVLLPDPLRRCNHLHMHFVHMLPRNLPNDTFDSAKQNKRIPPVIPAAYTYTHIYIDP